MRKYGHFTYTTNGLEEKKKAIEPAVEQGMSKCGSFRLSGRIVVTVQAQAHFVGQILSAL